MAENENENSAVESVSQTKVSKKLKFKVAVYAPTIQLYKILID